MSVTIDPMEVLGAEVHGLGAQPLEAADRDVLTGALAQFGLLVVHGLELTPAEQVELTRLFGEPDIHPIEAIRHPEAPEIIRLLVDATATVRDDDPDADMVIGDITWHSDLTYTAEPSRGALLYAVEVPPVGGETGFIDTARVYAELPDETKARIAGLEVVHSFGDVVIRTPEFPPVTHPLVHRHPVSGEPVLNVSPMFARSVVGLSEHEGAALLAELTAFATQERFTYFHRWTSGDLLIWDNWRTMHIATGHPKRFRRHMLRTTVRGDVQLVPA